MSTKLKEAAVANGFAATIDFVLSQAPRPGPKVKAIEKQAPIMAMVEPRDDSSDMSLAMAVDSWIFPSERPPTTRLATKVRKSTAATQSSTESMFPHIEVSRAVRRPYRSDNLPMRGEAIACNKQRAHGSSKEYNVISRINWA
ncbi:hypothetical protein VFPPC_17685 [Pochonia chlamydosporia 170]|uniref:Uncharacterized protein n=1 Tax=Pochonia chlamydosporia 170 TaxID=1380566 RepID=A0A219ARB0_METCM|nr:hypothetical protein VFPPC_17685 [Pochonia chlamydosporia 170]OWT43139.1 hypothetical protein VFPPC_17685 [Pochonia chlamydosporia 170]